MAFLKRFKSNNNDSNSDNSDSENRSALIHKIKLLTIGDSGTGKSSVILRYTEDQFTPSFITTIGIDYKIKNTTIDDGRKCKVQIWDTAGQERFRNITRAYYRGAQGIILVYDITDEQSFLNVIYWLEQIEKHATANPIVILLGNKSDLEQDREVTLERGQQLAKDYEILFFETSARKAININECFQSIIKQVIDVQESKCLLIKPEEKEKDAFTLHDGNRLAKFKQKINCTGCSK